MITLRLHTWAFLVSSLLIILFILCAVVFIDPLETWYLRTTVGPALQKEFGFAAETVRLNPAFEQQAFVIVAVKPSGVLANAGVKAGDRPWDYHGRAEMGFYQRLVYARHHEATLPLVRVEPGSDIPRLINVRVRRGEAPAASFNVGGDVKPPVVIERVDIKYPGFSPDKRYIFGVLVLGAVIDKTGAVREVRLERGPDNEFSRAAIAAVKQWRFKPGTLGGEPVDVTYQLSVGHFPLQEAEK